MRASLGATLAVIGALGAIATGSHAANAATPDTFTVVSAGATPGSPDQLTVVVDSPSTITDLTAGFGPGGFTLPLTPGATETDPADPTQTQSTWTATIPVGASGLALGTYTITVDGTFSDSGTDSVADPMQFHFWAESSVTLAAASDSLGYPDPSTTLSGQVTLTNPDGTPDTDFPADLKVDIQSAGATITTIAQAPVHSDGTFSYSIAPSASESVAVEVESDDSTVFSGAPSAPVDLTVTDVTPTLSLKVNPVTETYGKPITVTGTLTYTSGATPAAGQQIWVNATNSPTLPLATGTTNAAGGFSISVVDLQVAGTLYVGSADANDLTPVSAPLAVKVVHPTTISNFKTTLNQYWGLSVSGCLGFPASDKVELITHTTGLTVEYASAGGSWKKLGTINGNEADHACGTNGIEFTGSYEAPENYAYYRVVYAGTTGATSLAPTTGNSVLAWRYDDRITDYKISPTTVNAGGKLTISGVLQYWYSGWHNYSGQTIVIYLHPKSSNPTWYWLVKIKTNAKGQFSTTFKDPASATWQAAFEGNNSNGVGHLTAGSPEVYVRLK